MDDESSPDGSNSASSECKAHDGPFCLAMSDDGTNVSDFSSGSETSP